MKDAAKLKSVLLFLIAGFIVVTTASGYLYHQNNNYKNENHRLILVNDSILSENIELKNALRQKGSSAILPENIKPRERK